MMDWGAALQKEEIITYMMMTWFIAEISEDGSYVRTNTRGVDWSGVRDRAAGVGGVLSCFTDVSGASNYFYDGSGNVVDVLGAASETIAHYLYDSFGNKAGESGGGAAQPFQWSRCYSDWESKLLRYRYRYYSAEYGRWLNRDPLEEQAGGNLYAFVKNDPNGNIDLEGLLTMAIGHTDIIHKMTRPRLRPHGVFLWTKCSQDKGRFWLVTELRGRMHIEIPENSDKNRVYLNGLAPKGWEGHSDGGYNALLAHERRHENRFYAFLRRSNKKSTRRVGSRFVILTEHPVSTPEEHWREVLSSGGKIYP